MFQLREIWSSKGFSNDEFSPDAFTSFNFDKDPCIATGSFSGFLRLYFPSKIADSTPYTEISLNSPILQIKYGPLFGDINYLVVLHPNQLVLFSLSRAEKQVTVQFNAYKSFVLSHSSYNFIFAHLNGLQKPLEIIIQSLDGYLTIINSNENLSTFPIPHFFISCPFTYIPQIESFIFSTADYHIMCYRKKAILSENSSDSSAEWDYVFGEPVISIHSWPRLSKRVNPTNFEIAIIGNRSFAVFSETGSIKTLSRYCGGNCALSSLSLTSHPEKQVKCNNLIISITNSIDDSKKNYGDINNLNFSNSLFIYVNFQKVWQLSIPFPASCISIISADGIDGLVSIFNSSSGKILVGYLGTKISVSDNVLPPLPHVTQEELQAHLKAADEAALSITKQTDLDVLVNISLSSPNIIELTLHPKQGVSLSNIKIIFEVPSCVKHVDPIEISSLFDKDKTYQIQLENNSLPPGIRTISITTIFQSEDKDKKKMQKMTKTVSFELPLEFFIKSIQGRAKGSYKIIATANHYIPIKEIFSNYILKENHSLSFILQNNLLASMSEDPKTCRYRFESDTLSLLGFIIHSITSTKIQPKIKVAKERNNESSVSKEQQVENATKKEKFELKFAGDVPINSILEIVREHYQLRVQENKIKSTLNHDIKELEGIQKALIGKYESVTPENLDELNSLLAKALSKVKEDGTELIKVQNEIELSNGRLEATIYTFLQILSLLPKVDSKIFSLIQKYIPLSISNCIPGWEECFVNSVRILVSKIKGNKVSSFSPNYDFLGSFDLLAEAFDSLLNAVQ